MELLLCFKMDCTTSAPTNSPPHNLLPCLCVFVFVFVFVVSVFCLCFCCFCVCVELLLCFKMDRTTSAPPHNLPPLELLVLPLPAVLAVSFYE